MNPDGLSYLDMALESSKSGLGNLINGYWSPLYPALLYTAFAVLRPAPASFFPVVHLTNVLIFALTLLSFTFFIRSLFADLNDEGIGKQRGLHLLIPFCFSSFFWYTLRFTSPSDEKPDLCVSAVVFLVAALCCRIAANSEWRYFLALGLALGLGYYAKAVMFPLALILLALLFVLPPPGNKVRIKVMSAALVFLIVSAPLAALISKRVGHFSVGETGPINYAVYVNGLPATPSWIAGVNGTPKHALPVILNKPMILEFATPVAGTNPIGYDASYWFAGARPHFDLRQQWFALKVNLRFLFGVLSQMVAIISGMFMLHLLSSHRNPLGRRRNWIWWLTLWPAAACGLYALVHVEDRFLPGFLLIFSFALYSFLWENVGCVPRTAVLGTVTLMLFISTLGHVLQLSAANHIEVPEYIRVGEALRAIGIGPGDSIAVAGGREYESGGRVYRESAAFEAYYARYVGCRVIAAIVDPDDGRDVPHRPAPEFWHIDPKDQIRVNNVLMGIGVNAIVALDRPSDSTPSDWQQVIGTRYSILVLKTHTQRTRFSDHHS